MRRFTQVDVFTDELMFGNPVAVVHDAAELTSQQMADFASWTNLSETTFLSTPTDEQADYQVRIFTPNTELPFAGHPTLGSAHAWLEAGGVAQDSNMIIQQCAAGLVRIRRNGRTIYALAVDCDAAAYFPGRCGAPRRIRTYDPRIRSPMLYPAELGARSGPIMVVAPA